MNSRLFWVCALVTLVSALTSAGFSVAALPSSGEAHTYAMYAAVRSLSLAPVVLGVVGVRSRVGLVTTSFIMTLVQGGDAIIGAINHDMMKTLGPAFLAVVTLGVLIPFVRAQATN